LAALLDHARSLRIAVAGDFFLDRYLEIDAACAEISIETGLEAHQVTAIRNSPGAAGTVLNNLVALGVGTVAAVGAIGEDGQGFDLRRELEARGVDVSGLISAPDRFTPTYTKPMLRAADGEVRELSRIDIKNRVPTPPALLERICEALRVEMNRCDGLALVDQVTEPGCGVIEDPVRELLAWRDRGSGPKAILGDSRARIGEFRGVSVKPNVSEALRALGRRPDDDPSDEAVAEIAAELAKKTEGRAFVTGGPRGIWVADGETVERVEGIRISGPIDVVGAGDSASAGILVALAAGASPLQAAALGNLVASITVQQIGTTGTASPEQVLARYRESLA
jgi:rfaE bifunctional protein kinase chain/domain